jgi:predicted dehydrogenase
MKKKIIKKKVAIIGFGKLGLLHSALSNVFFFSKIDLIVEKNFFIRIFLKIFFLNQIHITNKIKADDFKDIDITILATPPFYTPKILDDLILANYRKKLLIEKPGFTSWEVMKTYLEKLKKFSTVKFGFMYRQNKIFQIGKKLLTKKIIDDIQYIKCSAYVDQKLSKNLNWRADKNISGGGVVILQGIHLIDILNWYFNKIILVKKKNTYSKQTNTEISSSIIFRTNNNCKIYFNASTVKKRYRKLEIFLFIKLKKGYIKISDDQIEYNINKIKKNIYNNQFPSEVFFELGDRSYSKQYEKLFYNKKNEVEILKKNLILIDEIYN